MQKPIPFQNRAARRAQRIRSRARPSSEAPSNPGGVLSALTASAMALPGLVGSVGGAAADFPVDEMTVDSSYSYYREDKLRPKRTAFASCLKNANGECVRDRMEIHTYQFRIASPVTDRTDVDVLFSFEDMTGASPWYVLPDLAGDRDGRPVQVMSAATIDDQRGDMLATGSYYFDWGKASGSTGFSIENDYYSWNIGLATERQFNDKNTTLSLGTGVSLDWIRPTDAKLFGRVSSEEKQTYRVAAGITQILTRHSTFQSTLSFEIGSGFLSDPYKKASVAGSTPNESRPDDRFGIAWLNRYRHHLSALNGTLHVDYKLYSDDWSINSHTFDIAYHQTLPGGVRIIPSFRYYTQSQADFYELFYLTMPSNGLFSSDYRLSPYGAISYRIKAEASLEDFPENVDWIASLSYERYESSGDLAFSRVDVANPGLVSFHLFAARITARF